MIKRVNVLAIILMILICPLQIYASHNMTIEKKDGTADIVRLNDHPIVTFDDENMTVSTPETVYSFLIDDIARIFYDFYDRVDVLDIRTETVVYDGDHICVYGLKKNSELTVTSIDGVLVRSLCLEADNPDSNKISIRDLSAGIYIISINSKSIKILKK